MSSSKKEFLPEIEWFPFLEGDDRLQAQASIDMLKSEKDPARREQAIYLLAVFAGSRAIDAYAGEEDGQNNTPAAQTMQAAYHIFDVLAGRGHGSAAFRAATCCLDGIGTEQNLFLASAFAEKAARRLGHTSDIQDLLIAVHDTLRAQSKGFKR